MQFISVQSIPLSPLVLIAAVLWLGTAQAADHRPVAVYRCTQNGTVVYSDTACAGLNDATRVDVRVANGYTPVSKPVEPKHEISASKKVAAVRDKSAELAEKHRKQCQSMKRSLDQIHAKMRSGYRVREGERMRDRETQLDERLRQERCH